MSIEKLALATISGPLEQFDQAVQLFVLGRQFHPESAVEQMGGMKTLRPFDLENPYAELMGDLRDTAEKLGIPVKPKQVEADLITPEQIRDYIAELRQAMDTLVEKRRELSLTVTDSQNMIDTLAHIQGVDEGLDGFINMRSVKFRFGRLPRAIYDEAMGRIDARDDTFFIHTSIEPDYIYCMYFALPSAREKVDAFFAALHFERIWIPDNIQGTPEEAVARLSAEREAAKAELEKVDLRLEALRDTNEGRILQYLAYMEGLSEAQALKQYAGRTEENFYLVGWIPIREAKDYTAEVERMPGFSCVLSDAEDIPDMAPPTKQHLNFFTRIFQPYLEMYGLPDYREIDPSFFMALTYTVLFGVMFGDVGQGLLLVLVGVYMGQVRKMWLGPVVICSGISATVFGFVYGSVFGYEELLPGFKVLEDSGSIVILGISAGVGVALIVVCMVLNIINGFRQGDPGKSLFSSNGVAGLVFYCAVLAGIVGIFVDLHLFTTPYILVLIVLPLLLMLFCEPLSKALRHEPGWMPQSLGGYLVESFFEVFEIALSFVSNTISFLRIGAFAIIHAGMMMVVYLLAETATGGYNMAVLVFGNLFVVALEALLVSIQLLRMEFYELFSRFYSDGGRKFMPHKTN